MNKIIPRPQFGLKSQHVGQFLEERLRIGFKVESVLGVVVEAGWFGGSRDGFQDGPQEVDGGVVVDDAVVAGEEQICRDVYFADHRADHFIEAGRGDEK